MCAGDGSSETILVRNCLELNSSLGENPQDVGVLRYWGRGHDALVTDLLTFVGLLKFSVRNSGVMSAS